MRQAYISALFALALAVALLGVASASAVHGSGAGDGYAAVAGRLSASINAAANDYDADDDGLIEVDNLARLNAIRWDLDGDGAADDVAVDEETAESEAAAENAARYRAAFPDPAPGMGCPSAGCRGYELAQGLDFDTDGDGATYTVAATGAVVGDPDDDYYNDGQGWTAIGNRDNLYQAAFDGNGYEIAHLFVNIDTDNAGLFGGIGTAGAVRNLGLIDVNVNYGRGTGGSLVGINMGIVTNCYSTGSVTVSGNGLATIGGLVGYLRLGGTINNSHAAVDVSGTGNAFESRDRIGGLAGMVIHSGSAITASYATGSVSSGDYARAGGLVGSLWLGGAITSSYAAGAVSSGDDSYVGGLVGFIGADGGHITASYAAGPVSGGANSSGAYSGVGGLAGASDWQGSITDSYAIGAVSARAGSNTGGLAVNGGGAVTNSYWDASSTGQTAGDLGIGLPTRDLQSPTGNAGIYENWQSSQWDFGTARQYPAVQYDGSLVPGQRQTYLQVDWNHPVVGEPVVAGLDVAGADAVAWQWQRSAAGAKWRDIPNAAASVYVPVAADAERGGHFLRAQITFTKSGKRQTLTTYNTAKVHTSAEAAPADADATSFAPDVAVGRRLDYTVPGENIRYATYRWQRCDDQEMTDGCRYLPIGDAAYTITAADVGKYLRAYVYYADGDAWKRVDTPILGPVVAAPASSAP